MCASPAGPGLSGRLHGGDKAGRGHAAVRSGHLRPGRAGWISGGGRQLPHSEQIGQGGCAGFESYNLTNYLYLPLQVDRSDVQEVGLALCHSDKIRKLSFTGSTPVGKWLMRESASTVKKVPSLYTFIH